MKYITDIKALMSDIKSAMPLSQAIGLYLQLQKDGANSYSCLCPWHKETQPSFKISDSKSIWKCWGACSGDKSKAGTDVIKFIQSYFGLSFIEAVHKFIDDTGIDLSQHFRLPTQEEQWFDYYTQINHIVAQACHQQLLANTQVLSKFTVDRNIMVDTLKKFNVGYCSDISSIQSALSGIDDVYIQALDLKRYEMWDNRIVYPIHDYTGNIVLFRNRALSSGVPKFIGTTSSSPVFPSVLPIYGFHLARSTMRQNDGVLVVVEGHNDVIHMVDKGIINVVGSMGTNLSSEHFSSISPYGVKKLIIMYDGDNAGQTALNRFCESVNYSGDIILAVAQMPHPFDPDEYLNLHQASELRSIIDSNEHYIDHYFNSVDGPLNTSADRHAHLHKVKSRMTSLTGINQQMALSKLSEKVDIAKEVLDDYYRADHIVNDLYSIDAELIVLANIISSNECRLEAINKLSADMFWLRKHASLYSLVCSMDVVGTSIGFDTVWLELQKQKLDYLWPKDEFDRLNTHITNTYDVFIDEVLDRYARRYADATADRIKVDIHNMSLGVHEVLDSVNTSITKMIMSHTDQYSPDENTRGIERTMEFIQQQVKNPGMLPGIDLGPSFPCLTQTIGGLRKQTMNVVGGLPGVGKTSMMEKWALYQAVHLQIPILWLALEMRREAFDIRNIAILSTMDDGLPIQNFEMERGYLDQVKADRVTSIAAKYRASPFYAITTGTMSVQQAVAIARYYKHVCGVQVVYIDYVQLMSSEGKFNEDWNMQKYISKSMLENISRDLDLSVVAASQMSRNAIQATRGRIDNLPGGENVAGSVQYWADSDTFIAPFQKTQAQIEHWPNTGLYGINVSKNRNGVTGLIHANYMGMYTSWFEANQDQIMPIGQSEL